MSDKSYLVSTDNDSDCEVFSQTAWEVDDVESKGCDKRKFFKVDSEGFIYSTFERPSEVLMYRGEG